MIPIFNDPDLCIKFCNESQDWLGTPFHKGGRIKGRLGGTDCVHLGEGIFRNVLGDLPQIEFPEYSLDETFHRADSRLEQWLDSNPRLQCLAKFDEDERNKLSRLKLLPGDFLGFRFGQAMHHLGYSQGGKKFIQCRQGVGTVESWLDDGTYEFRLLAAYRPLK